MMTVVHVGSVPSITRSEAERLAGQEYERLVAQLGTLDAADWTSPTDCTLWDVRAVAGHCVGEMGDLVSLRAFLRRMLVAQRRAKASGGPMVDGMTSSQVAEMSGLSVEDLIARATDLAPRAARWRSHAPGLFRRASMTQEVGGRPEKWTMSYLLDVILTRDTWMHRVDIARATGRDLELTADHDARIVADVVAEWARRHGAPVRLSLTGEAGGEFVSESETRQEAAPHITMDAVEFCRTLAGRAVGDGLMSQEVPF